MSTPAVDSAVLRRLSELETEASRLYQALRNSRTEARLEGLFLVLETGGAASLIAATAVREIVRVLHFQPITGASSAVLGSFLYRGEAAVGLRLGASRDFALEAHVVVLNALHAGSVVGLVVDRVESVVEGVAVLGAAEAAEAGIDDTPTKGVLSLCRVGQRVLPLLAVSALLEEATPARVVPE